MHGSIRTWLTLLPATLAICIGSAMAQDGGMDDLRARVEKLERENQELRHDLDGVRRIPPVEAPRPAGEGLIQPVATSRFEEMDADPPAGISKKDLDKALDPFKGLKGVKVGMTAYLDYSFGEKPKVNFGQEAYNLFSVARGYLTVQKEITPWFYARVTPDVYQNAVGDWELRLKYYYAEFRPGDVCFLTDMQSEWGLGHMPWLDFEEHVNPYRCQGTMPIERAGVFNSADLGASLRGNFGGQVPDAEETLGTKHYDGYYGSWHFGVYNGAGYHAVEHNGSKPFEGRITLRPLPEAMPGLQLTYFGIAGLGNTTGLASDYDVNMVMLSYQKEWLVLTAQYFGTRGNAAGTWVDANGRALNTEGYSFFANYRLPTREQKLWLFSRYDHFNQDVNQDVAARANYDMYIGGVAYYLYKNCLIMMDYEETHYGSGAGTKGSKPAAGNNLGRDQKGQIVLQIDF